MVWASATLLQRVGRRGAALLFFTLLDFVYCLGLLTVPRPLSPFYAWMDHVAPLSAWAGAWGAVGIICFFYAFRQYDSPGFMAAVGLKTGWGLLSFLGWAAGTADRGYVSGVIWLAFAAFVFLIAGGIPPAPQRPSRRRTWTR